MLYWALVFAVIALVAGVFGFGGVASAAAGNGEYEREQKQTGYVHPTSLRHCVVTLAT